ncbi:MAG: cytochrome c peroxidase, partial [Pseudomonadota bacterium]
GQNIVPHDLKAEYERPVTIPAPDTNPVTDAKVRLGEILFSDPRLSIDQTMSCASCHDPDFGWEDGQQMGLGHDGSRLKRHTPTLLNLAWAPLLGWDGRFESFEDQAKSPIMSGAEMGMTSQLAADRVRAIEGYRAMFDEAFPGEEISLDIIAKALASYQRTLVSREAPFDRWIQGDETAISNSAKNGFLLFNGKAQCAICHTSWRFTDDGFHDIGLPDALDSGRGGIVPGVTTIQNAFKTPTLRDIAKRGPFMHDGSLRTLEDVIHHYQNGFTKRESVSWSVKGFELTGGEQKDLVAFLKTLTSETQTALPTLPF